VDHLRQARPPRADQGAVPNSATRKSGEMMHVPVTTDPSRARTRPSGPTTSRLGANRALVPGRQESCLVVPSASVSQTKSLSDGDPWTYTSPTVPPPAQSPLGGMLRSQRSPGPSALIDALGLEGQAHATSPAEARTTPSNPRTSPVGPWCLTEGATRERWIGRALRSTDGFPERPAAP
jgi:hypothetical protein